MLCIVTVLYKTACKLAEVISDLDFTSGIFFIAQSEYVFTSTDLPHRW
jgi:hypothetical protein